MFNRGSYAHHNGSHLEDIIATILQRHGYRQVDKSVFDDYLFQEPIYAQHVHVGDTIYDTKRICDFILFHPTKFKKKLIIECKWQQSGGSVDEKYPFLIYNIQKIGIDTVIVLDGQGYKKGAENWLKNQVGGFLIKVVNMSELIKMTNNKFFGDE